MAFKPERDMPVTRAENLIVLQDGNDAELHAIPTREMCDFCCEVGVPLRTYECNPVMLASVIDDDGDKQNHISTDAWGACAVCEQLIEADDRQALAKRSAENFLRLNAGSEGTQQILAHPQGRQILLREITHTQAGFFGARLTPRGNA